MTLINAHNVIKGGGINVVISIIDSFLEENDHFILVIPGLSIYRDFIKKLPNYKKAKISEIVYSKPGLSRFIYKWYVNKYQLPKLIKKWQILKVFSLGNIGFASAAKQLVLVQNAYATLTDNRIWERIPFKQRLYLKFMQKQILKNLKHADVIAIQTQTMRNNIKKLLGIRDEQTVIHPNVIRTDMFNTHSRIEERSDKYKFLFLSKLFPHKNFEILEPLAERITNESLPVTITLTLDNNIPSEKLLADRLLKLFPSVFKNQGLVAYNNLPEIYAAHDAIFFPTLLESFSATYIEAMAFGKTIVTSDLEFAREICGDLAFYFNPFDVSSAFETIKLLLCDKHTREIKISAYKKKLEELSGNNFSVINKNLYNAI